MPLMQQHVVTALFDNFPDPVLVADSDRIIIKVNDAASRQFGYAPGELLNQPARLIYASDEDYDLCVNRGLEPPQDGRALDSVYAYRKKDGSVFTGRFRSIQMIDGDGTLEGIIGVVHDISDYLELDMEHKRIREMLDTALAVVPEGFAIFDKNERLIVFNEAYRKICGPAGPKLRLGMTAEAIMLAAYEEGYYPDALPGSDVARHWLESRLTDFRNPDGKAKLFPYADGRWLRVENMRTGDGNTVALRIDVTELKEAELALNRQRLEYFSLVQNLPDFITRISRDKRYLFVNEPYARFIGRSADDLVGQIFFDFVPPGDRARVSTVLDSLTPEAPIVTAEQRRILADGSVFWILWSNMAIFDGAKLVEFVTIGRDITKLKQQQARIDRQRGELQRKNEALNQFTGTVSHDLKAPLRHISMFSEMIVDDLRDGKLDDIATYADHLRHSARRMDMLIESLLDYSQIAYEIGNWRPVPLNAVVNDAILNLESHIREADATVHVDPLPVVRGDAELLKRLAQNLIGNSVKYRRPDLKPVIRIHAETIGDAVHFYVEDNGIGIEPRFAQKIFDVFQRLHRDETVYQGTGIGLALAKRIVESHNGTIELDTSFPEGARFVIVFPQNVSSDRGKQIL